MGAQGCFQTPPSQALARIECARLYSGKVKSLNLPRDCSAALFSKALYRSNSSPSESYLKRSGEGCRAVAEHFELLFPHPLWVEKYIIGYLFNVPEPTGVGNLELLRTNHHV